MLWFGWKKAIGDMGKKIKGDITELISQSLNNRVLIEKLDDKVVGRDEIMLLIENAVLKSHVSSVSHESQSQAVSVGLKRSQAPKETIETKLINRVRRNKRGLVMAEIEKLPPSLSVAEMYGVIVLEKGLCSKASFYRYVASLKGLNKSQSLNNGIEVETS